MASQIQRLLTSWLLCGVLLTLTTSSQAFSSSSSFLTRGRVRFSSSPKLAASTQVEEGAAPNAPPPTLNGKRVLPLKIMSAGLKGSKTAAVYAVLNSSYQRGSEGWEATEYVGVTQDLEASLQAHLEQHGTDKVAHIRALSFTFPQPNAMQDVATQWREQVSSSGKDVAEMRLWENDVMDYLFDDEDEDDDDDDFMEMTTEAMGVAASGSSEETIVSPFDESGNTELPSSHGEMLAFTAENVDKVLDEVRPYLIADGGNVSVERVDEDAKNVYLKLEGACGSCSSSTVTMQMGIEKVLKENFSDIKEILQVEDDPESKPQELTYEAVEDEVNRLKPAIIAMGGVVQIVSVDTALGKVELEFQGSNKVQQGLELAIRDVPFVNDVQFVTGDN